MLARAGSAGASAVTVAWARPLHSQVVLVRALGDGVHEHGEEQRQQRRGVVDTLVARVVPTKCSRSACTSSGLASEHWIQGKTCL